MKLIYAFGLIPVPVFYTDRLPDGVGGRAIGPLIFIRPKYRDYGDEGIHQHELDHVKQFWRAWLVVAMAALWPLARPEALNLPSQDALMWAALAGALAHPLLYLVARGYRLYCEAHAYATQMRYPNGLGWAMTLDQATNALTQPRYRLSVTADEARRELLKYFE